MSPIYDSIQLREILSGFGPDELRLVLRLAQRIQKGIGQYGHLNVATDARDWGKERREELDDAIIYGAIEELKNERPANG